MKTFYPPLSGSCTEKTSVLGGRLGKQPLRSTRWEWPGLCSLPASCALPRPEMGNTAGQGSLNPSMMLGSRVPQH